MKKFLKTKIFSITMASVLAIPMVAQAAWDVSGWSNIFLSDYQTVSSDGNYRLRVDSKDSEKSSGYFNCELRGVKSNQPGFKVFKSGNCQRNGYTSLAATKLDSSYNYYVYFYDNDLKTTKSGTWELFRTAD